MIIYVLTLAKHFKECQDRLEVIKNYIKEANLNKYEIIYFDGINGALLDDELKNPNLSGAFLYGRLKKVKWSAGAALSHIKMWKNIQDKVKKNQALGNEDFLILEDDVVVNRNILNIITNSIPNNYDICFLDTLTEENFNYKDNEIYSTKVKKINFQKHNVFQGVYNPPWPDYPGIGCHAYLIKGENINKVLTKMIPMVNEIDISMICNPMLNIYMFDPKMHLAKQFFQLNNNNELMPIDEQVKNYSKVSMRGKIDKLYS